MAAEHSSDSDLIIETIWAFARGDLRPQEFEQWVYSESALEDRLGTPLYLDVLSAGYSSRMDVDDIRKVLTEYARGAKPLRCQCITLPALILQR